MSLNEPIKTLEKSSNGIDLKTNLITLLLSLLSDSEFVADTILGYTAGDFLKKEDLNAEYQSIADSFEYILNEGITGSLYNNISKVSAIKDQIRSAINDLYGSAVVPLTGEMSYFEKYSEIITDIPEYLRARTLEDITVEENGEYESDDGKAYSSVVVSIPEKTLTTRVISENGTYYAQQDGADGYEYVTVAVTGSVQKFTVRFWSEDRQQILYTAMNIPYGGYAQFDATYPESEQSGMYFTGWNPQPVNVTSDMDCYPVFSNVPSGENEITDSWETIVANRGAGYPLGSYKYITFDPSFVFMTPTISSGLTGPYYGISGIKPIQMVKVATGEGGSTSTWLSISNIFADLGAFYDVLDDPTSIKSQAQDAFNGKSAYVGFAYMVRSGYGKTGWADDQLRTFLNGDFLNKLLPPVIRNAIVSVPKASAAIDGGSTDFDILSNYQTRDKVWLPSVRELLGNSNRIIQSDIESGVYDTNNMYKRKCLDNNTYGVSYDSNIFSDEPIIYGSTALYPFKDYINFKDYTSSHALPEYTYEINCRDAIQRYVNSNNNVASISLSRLIYTLDTSNTHVVPRLAASQSAFSGAFGFCL